MLLSKYFVVQFLTLRFANEDSNFLSFKDKLEILNHEKLIQKNENSVSRQYNFLV